MHGPGDAEPFQLGQIQFENSLRYWVVGRPVHDVKELQALKPGQLAKDCRPFLCYNFSLDRNIETT